ncbi:MAG: hypothetical protein AAF721_34870 [Myxococcota bacterium]
MRTASFLFALGCLTSSGCEFFHTTTVPATDTSKPWAAVALYVNGDHEQLRVGDRGLVDAATTATFETVTFDPFQFYLPLAAGVDGGGVAEVRMGSRRYYQCLYGDTSTQLIENWTYQTVTQAGEPGDTVDDGLYIADFFRAADHIGSVGPCDADGYRIIMEWYSRATDFHGNVAHMGLGRVTYYDWDG